MLNEDDILFADDSSEDSNDLFFADDDSSESQSEVSISEDKWNIMIVDDEAEIHNVTEFALGDYEYKGKKLNFIHAYTGSEAIELLQNHSNIALMLLDVVMESNDAGLRVVERVRSELDNHFIRIIMRTGQPGQAPEEDVILKYDINDYKNKTELTDKRLFTTITTGLRSYNDIMEIESYRQNLERKVEERTAEVLAKNAIIEKKNKDITSSINYAKRIQEAMLPHLENIKRVLPESFVLFKPKDIVSGDFYWFAEKQGKIVLAAVDCTGHGVPGAFMSMVGDAHLKQIVGNEAILSPDFILNKLHIRVRESLKQSQTRNRDGMDMTVCVIDRIARTIEFAGAKNSMIYIQNNEVKQIKGDRMPIGGEQKEEERIFSRQVIPILAPTTVYMFSDGFQDQFGGPDNKKYMIKRLRELLLKIHERPFEEQRMFLAEIFENWKGDYSQTDDVLIMGFKVNY